MTVKTDSNFNSFYDLTRTFVSIQGVGSGVISVSIVTKILLRRNNIPLGVNINFDDLL